LVSTQIKYSYIKHKIKPWLYVKSGFNFMSNYLITQNFFQAQETHKLILEDVILLQTLRAKIFFRKFRDFSYVSDKVAL